MSPLLQRAKRLLCLAASLAALAYGADARACSPTQTMVYKSAKTVWCVEGSILAKFGAFPPAYFPFGDQVIDELVALFDVPANGVYTFEASVETGGAHTGSECCGLGVTVTGDAFYGNAYGVQGFWGYLLSLHETINDWTGQVSNGWPTDFWADHVSAFPNSMDWHIMSTLGAAQGNADLVASSAAQKARFYPGGDSTDPRVPMFDAIFDLPSMGYTGWSRVFSLVQKDKLAWDGVAMNGNNPDLRRTEYVTALVSLGVGQSVLATLQVAGVANGASDGHPGDAPYTGSQADIAAIATAHCAIWAAAAQGADETADWMRFRQGDYAGVTAHGTCGAGCPAECGCQGSTNRCAAPWLADSGSSSSASSGAGGHAGAGGDTGAGGADGTGSTTGGGGEGGAGTPMKAGGCSCRTPGREGGDAPASWLLAPTLAALALVRARGRRR